MFTARRLLPSISSLVALEAVDRLGSASAAATELSLTHSAISRQIKVLEGQLGMTLAVRDGVRLKLTPAASEYCDTVRACLRDLSRASIKLKANPMGGSLNLAILPSFGMHWLAPKLRMFGTAHPEVTVNLSSRLEPFDFVREEFDAAIHYGQRTWQNVHFLHIADEHVLPVCAPTLVPAPLERAEQLLQFPLLHIETRPTAWEDWFDHHGIAARNVPGMIVDQFATMAQASVHGLGVAMLPLYLAQIEIDAGRLVCPFGEPVRALGSYFLVWPDSPPPRPPLTNFVNWMRGII